MGWGLLISTSSLPPPALRNPMRRAQALPGPQIRDRYLGRPGAPQFKSDTAAPPPVSTSTWISYSGELSIDVERSKGYSEICRGEGFYSSENYETNYNNEKTKRRGERKGGERPKQNVEK